MNVSGTFFYLCSLLYMATAGSSSTERSENK